MKTILLILSILTFSFVQSQIVTIPDANFKNALVNTNCIDTNGDGIADADADANNDGEIQVSEAEAVVWLDVSSQSISSLEGIQSFVNITDLRCIENSLSILDVSQNTDLRRIYCGQNQLTSLDVTQNPELRVLNCTANQIVSLDMSQNPFLRFLISRSNLLTSVDVTQNPDLEILNCSENQLTNLDVSQNPVLSDLRCWSTQLTSLDITQNPNLEVLLCWGNELLDNLNLKNGNNVVLIDMDATLNPILGCIEVDDVNYAQNAPDWAKDAGAIYSENCALGTQNFELSTFSLSPNPTHGTLNINTEEQIDTIKIFSLQGQLLEQSLNTSINVSYLNSGLYFVQVSIAGKTSTKKFIKI